jgi:carbamate kinase
MPFDVCGAMSQGYIGYHIQQALRKSLEQRHRHLPVVTVITQVVVDQEDPAFEYPSKPIGPFYTAEEAKVLEQEKGYIMKEDAGRGYRRVVPSPEPVEIVEIDTIKTLWNTTITVTCGGGGVPVVRNDDGSLTGVAAVIDKDLAAECLAEGMDADIIVVDFMETHTIDPEHFASKAKFSPFADEEVRGKVLYTMVGGKMLT